MLSLSVVKFQVVTNFTTCFHNEFVGMQVDFFVVDATPQALDKYIAHPAAFAVHADLYIIVLKCTSKGRSGELSTLMRQLGIRALCRAAQFQIVSWP